MKRGILSISIVFNMVVVIALYGLLSLQAGAARLYVMSTFREMMKAGVLSLNNPEMMNYRNGELLKAGAKDWDAVSDYMAGGYHYAASIALVIICMCINVIFVAIACRGPKPVSE